MFNINCQTNNGYRLNLVDEVEDIVRDLFITETRDVIVLQSVRILPLPSNTLSYV